MVHNALRNEIGSQGAPCGAGHGAAAREAARPAIGMAGRAQCRSPLESISAEIFSSAPLPHRSGGCRGLVENPARRMGKGVLRCAKMKHWRRPLPILRARLQASERPPSTRDEGRSNRRTGLSLLIVPRRPASACAMVFQSKAIRPGGSAASSPPGGALLTFRRAACSLRSTCPGAFADAAGAQQKAPGPGDQGRCSEMPERYATHPALSSLPEIRNASDPRTIRCNSYEIVRTGRRPARGTSARTRSHCRACPGNPSFREEDGPAGQACGWRRPALMEAAPGYAGHAVASAAAVESPRRAVILCERSTSSSWRSFAASAERSASRCHRCRRPVA